MTDLSLIYKQGDMFTGLNKEEVFLHSCNAQGNWGAGIASQFSDIFPKSYQAHKKVKNKVGMGYVLEDDGYKVGCLITSKFYGRRKDPPKTVVLNTFNALLNLFDSLESPIVINSPKINAGMFKVDWAHTEKVIKLASSKFPSKTIKWIVWEY